MTTPPGVPPDGAQPAAGRYAWYVIGVLMLAYAFAFLDRQILALMVEPIKRDLGVGYWIPSFFIRTYGLAPGDASHYLFRYGLISTIVGAAGIVAGGWLADRLFRRGDDGYIKAVL